MLVDKGLTKPLAVTPIITISLLKFFGKLVKLCSIPFCCQSIHTRPIVSVFILPNCGILSACMPCSLNFIWKLGSLAITLKTSNDRFGYNVSPLDITRGILRTTPSTSGNVLTIPTPIALSSNDFILAMIPG